MSRLAACANSWRRPAAVASSTGSHCGGAPPGRPPSLTVAAAATAARGMNFQEKPADWLGVFEHPQGGEVITRSPPPSPPLGSISAASAGGLPALPTFSVPVKPVLTRPRCPPPPPSWPLACAEPTASADRQTRQQARPPAGLVAFEAARSSAARGLWCWSGDVPTRSWIVRQRRQRVMKGHSFSRRAGSLTIAACRHYPPPPIAINSSGFGLDLLSKRMPQPRSSWEKSRCNLRFTVCG